MSNIGNGSLHPDFGQDYYGGDSLYGIPYNIVHSSTTPALQVVIDAYPDESDLMNVPIPANVVLEGDLQNGPTFGVDNRGDSHLIVWDADQNVAYELYRASRPSENSDGKWHADGQAVWDMKTNTFRTLHWTSADAAGLPILPGLVRPDEGLPVSEGGQGVINHAIRFTLQNSKILNQFIYPASHVANPGNNNPAIQPPMGARFRLKSSVDISTLNPESRVIAQAMKDYGLIVADNGSNFFFTGASQSVDTNNNSWLTWNDDDIQNHHAVAAAPAELAHQLHRSGHRVQALVRHPPAGHQPLQCGSRTAHAGVNARGHAARHLVELPAHQAGIVAGQQQGIGLALGFHTGLVGSSAK